MANILNQKMCTELTELYKEAEDCIFVDFQGLTVEEVNSLRSSLTKDDIRMQVVRSSLSDIVLKGMDRSGYEEMLKGPTAVVWGGDGIVQLSKSINDFAKKAKKLEVKGGFLSAKPIDKEDVKKLTTVPDRPILLGMIVSSFMDPIQGLANGVNSILSSVANVIDALREKREKEGSGGEAEA